MGDKIKSPTVAQLAEFARYYDCELVQDEGPRQAAGPGRVAQSGAREARPMTGRADLMMVARARG